MVDVAFGDALTLAIEHANAMQRARFGLRPIARCQPGMPAVAAFQGANGRLLGNPRIPQKRHHDSRERLENRGFPTPHW